MISAAIVATMAANNASMLAMHVAAMNSSRAASVAMMNHHQVDHFHGIIQDGSMIMAKKQKSAPIQGSVQRRINNRKKNKSK